MKRVCIAAFILSSCLSLFAQRDIRTDLVYKAKANFDFTEEWQYLSTDLYLFNTNKFGLLINELITNKRDHRKSDKSMEMLTITAALHDIRFFDNQEIIYPIYNFQIDKDSNKEYSTRISNYKEVVRLIDNLPLTRTNETVEAEITARAVTNHQRIEIFSLVSNQLLTIAKLTNPTDAVMTLVGEFGNFLKSASAPSSSGKKQNYEFSSTIRLYEGENFNQRLYSIRVYAFLPPDKQVRFDGREISRYLEAQANPKIDRKELERMMRFKDYPFIVVVNYKSRYQMPIVIGDEVNPEMIRKREEQVKKDYRLELINEATYSQEREFIEYLKEFSQVKKSVESYSLATEAGANNDISQALYGVVKEYYEFKHVLQGREREFSRNSVYQNVFREKYHAIMRNAELYLDKDFHLKSSRALVHSLLELDKVKINSLDAFQRERFLETLYAVNLPGLDYLNTTVLGQEIIRKTQILEQAHFSLIFQGDCSRLRGLPANDETLAKRNDLLQAANRSNCKSCKEKVKKEVADFDKRYQQHKLNLLLQKEESLLKDAEDRLFGFLKRQECMQGNFESLGEDKPAYIDLLEDRFEETSQDLSQLDQLIQNKDQVDKESMTAVKAYSEQVETLIKDIAQGFGYVCDKMKSLCDCE